MVGISIKSWTMTLSLSLVFVQSVYAQEGGRARLLAEEMQSSKVFQDSISICVEKAEQRKVEDDVAKTPGLLGGIVPGDKDWAEAKELYIRMLKAGCAYDPAPPLQAFERALGQSLSRKTGVQENRGQSTNSHDDQG